MRIIVALSGGKASAWCADWAIKNFGKENVVLYFNDTKWEHEDLYRFLNDLSTHWNLEILYDNDGRNPEDLFYDVGALANNFRPFCSQYLKGERLQKYYQDGDTLIFGIGPDEKHRANRIGNTYKTVMLSTGKKVTLLFPLISENVEPQEVDDWLKQIGIEEPLLYKLGFKHNNCAGGCIRAGKKSWQLLYEKLPNVFLERERVEREFREFSGKDVHFLVDETLEELRHKIEDGQIAPNPDVSNESGECIGICSTMA